MVVACLATLAAACQAPGPAEQRDEVRPDTAATAPVTPPPVLDPPARSLADLPDVAASTTPARTPAKPASPGRRALIIAIGLYPQPSVNGYRRINSANDVPLMESALRAQGFDPLNVRVLRDADADRDGILAALEQLIVEAHADDVVVVHYSGHGDQLTDDDGDEIDGFDEVLVPHGAPANEFFKRTYGPAAAARAAEYASDPAAFRHVRDDELNRFLTRLRRKVGPGGNVVMSIDSCHSGTGTRGEAGPMPRGTGDPIGNRAPAPVGESRRADQAGLFESAPGEAGAALAPYVVLSASRQGEMNFETRDEDGTPVGPLSLALSRVLPGVRTGDSYQALFDRVAVLMSSLAPNQLPQLEGHGDMQVFGGRAVVQAPYYRIVRVVNPRLVVLAGGQVTGLSKGSRVVFYPIGASPTDAPGTPPIARGAVDAAGPTETRVALDAALAPSTDLRQSWAFVTESAFGDLALAVHVDAGLRAEDRSAIVTRLGTAGLARLVDASADADIVVGQAAPPVSTASAMVSVMTAADRLPIGEPIAPGQALARQVEERVANYARNRFLRRITMRTRVVDVQLSLVPATHQYEDPARRRGCVGSNTEQPGGAVRASGSDSAWQLRAGDGFLLRLHNVGARAAFAAILELYPDGTIGQLYPEPDHSAAEAVLEPNQERLFTDLCFSASPPYGTYVLKAFAIDATGADSRPIDFEPILTRRTTRSDGVPGPFEQLLASTYGGTRSDPPRILTGGGSTDDVLVRVVP